MKAKYIKPNTEIIRLRLSEGILEEHPTVSVPVKEVPGGVDIWDAEGNGVGFFDEEGEQNSSPKPYSLWDNP